MGKEYDKKYTWVIKNFSSLQSEEIYSSKFVAGGCNWRFVAFPKGNKGYNFLSLYLDLVDFESLPYAWRRHVQFRLTVVNQFQKKLSRKRETERSFEEENIIWGFHDLLSLTELHDKSSGFLVNEELMVVAEINVVGVIGKLDVIGETSAVIESIDFNGFHVLSSQVESLKRLFHKHPNIALKFRPESQLLKTAYMNLLLGVIYTLNQSPQEISKQDLADASAAVVSLKVVGFNLDWLEERVDELKEIKERVVAVETQMHEIDEKMKNLKEKFSDLETLLEKEKADLLASRSSFKLDDVF